MGRILSVNFVVKLLCGCFFGPDIHIFFSCLLKKYYLCPVKLKKYVMKKMLFTALAGIMLLAFTQCDGKASKEFQDQKELSNKLEKAINKAETCEELENCVITVVKESLDMIGKQYADDEKMTDAEKEKSKKMDEDLKALMQKKAEKLGCEDFDVEKSMNMNMDLGGLDESLEEVEEDLDNLNENLDDLNENLDKIEENQEEK